MMFLTQLNLVDTFQIMSLTNLLPKLKSAFGHDEFSSKEQEEAIRTLMKGKEDVLITMPTGRSSGGHRLGI